MTIVITRFSTRNVVVMSVPTTYNEKDRTWNGAKRSSMYNHETSIGQIIFNTMKNWPKNICQISDSDGVALTNQQGITWAIRIAQFLKKRGLTHKDNIGIVARNTTYMMPLGVACLMNATPFYAVNPFLDEATIRYVYEITKPMLIFCDGLEYKKVLAATAPWNPEIYTITDPVEGVPKLENLLEPTTTEIFYRPEPLVIGGNQTMGILCSSGTTGLPKAVCISNSTFIQDTLAKQVNSESIIFTSSSLDWITGLWAFIFSTVFGCTRIISNKPFSPEHFVYLVQKYKITYVAVAPYHLSALVRCPEATTETLASIATLFYSGGLAHAATLQRAQTLMKGAFFNSGYGMTEVGGIAFNNGLSNAVSAGRVVPDVRVRIVDEDGHSLKHNGVGEIYVHTGQIWSGYYGNPIETRRMQDFEGWFHTGDVGYFDDDNYLYIVDRKKEILKYKSLHYWPTEIEYIIMELAEVLEVCVVAVYDERHGDAAGALVVRQLGSQISEQKIVEHVSKRLSGVEKQLNAGVRFTDKMPVNVNGKAMRKAALDIFLGCK